MGILKGVLIIVILAAAIGFAVSNDEAVSLRYFGFESQPLPIFLWSFLFLLAGVVFAGIFAFFLKIGVQAKLHRLKKTLVDLEKKRNDLKSSLPSL